MVFRERNRYSHAQAGFHAFDGTFQPYGTIGDQLCAKSRSHPEDIFGLDKHAADADVARAGLQAGGAPLDFEAGLIRIARCPAPIGTAKPEFPHGHRRRSSRRWMARKIEPEQRAYNLEDTPKSSTVFQTPRVDVLFPPFSS